jgi:hypothetical protein
MPRASRITRRQLLRTGALSGVAIASYVLGCSDGDTTDTAPTRPPAPTPSQTEVATSAIVRQIDHILLKTDDAQRLFAFLTETLQLPVAWPLFTYRGFSSGAAGLGSVNLEVLQPVEGDTPEFARRTGTYPIGLAFEPITVDSAVRELDARAIMHSAPFEDGINDAIRWTSIDLAGPPECPVLLLVKYAFDQDVRRSQLGAMLAERNGGPLGVDDVAAVEIGASDIVAAAARWSALLRPIDSDDTGTFRFERGPALRLLPADGDAFQRIILRVRSLDAATRALNDIRALGETGPGWVDLALEDGAPAPLRLYERYPS